MSSLSSESSFVPASVHSRAGQWESVLSVHDAKQSLYYIKRFIITRETKAEREIFSMNKRMEQGYLEREAYDAWAKATAEKRDKCRAGDLPYHIKNMPTGLM